MFGEPLFAIGPRWAWTVLAVATMALSVCIALGSPRVDPPIWPDAVEYLFVPGIGFAAAGASLHQQAVGRLALAAGLAAMSASANLHWPDHHLLLGAVPAAAALFAVPLALLNDWERAQFDRNFLWSIVATFAFVGISAKAFPV